MKLCPAHYRLLVGALAMLLVAICTLTTASHQSYWLGLPAMIVGLVAIAVFFFVLIFK